MGSPFKQKHYRGTESRPGCRMIRPKHKGAGNAGCLSRTHGRTCDWRKHMSVVTAGFSQKGRTGIGVMCAPGKSIAIQAVVLAWQFPG
jgi:hypothetical protein